MLGDQPALVFEPNDPEDHHRVLTYKELHFKVMQFANVLKNNGIRKGDRVCIYMGMVPEAAVAMLACARVGAVHSVVFGGFSADAVTVRNNDAKAKLVITADGGFRKGAGFALKPAVDEALKGDTNVSKVLVVKRTGQETAWVEGRDLWWHEEVAKDNIDRPEWMGSVDFSGLKLKLIGSLVAISVIELLKDFIELSGEAEVGEGTIWRIIIHLTFVVSGVLFALMDWIADKREFKGTHA